MGKCRPTARFEELSQTRWPVGGKLKKDGSRMMVRELWGVRWMVCAHRFTMLDQHVKHQDP